MCFRMQSTRPGDMETAIRRWVTRSLFPEGMLLQEVQAQTLPTHPVVFDSALLPADWGLRPDWAERSGRSNEGRLFTLNCVAEEMFDKPSFKRLAPVARCLIPLDHFVEWRHEDDGTTTRYHLKLKDGEPTYLGGLCQLFEDGFYFTVCTIPANEQMRYIHNTKKRMPLFVRENDYDRWMTPGPEEQIADLLIPNDGLPLDAVAQPKEPTVVKPKKVLPKQETLF